MNVKVNDNVLVIAGKDKGKQGKVLATSPKTHTVVVEGVRIQKKHEKARKANDTSKIVDVEGPIDVSNVKVICPVCGKATKVKHSIVDGKKVRVCTCGAVLDKAFGGKKQKDAVKEEAPKKRERKRVQNVETAEETPAPQAETVAQVKEEAPATVKKTATKSTATKTTATKPATAKKPATKKADADKE